MYANDYAKFRLAGKQNILRACVCSAAAATAAAAADTKAPEMFSP